MADSWRGSEQEVPNTGGERGPGGSTSVEDHREHQSVSCCSKISPIYIIYYMHPSNSYLFYCMSKSKHVSQRVMIIFKAYMYKCTPHSPSSRATTSDRELSSDMHRSAFRKNIIKVSSNPKNVLMSAVHNLA